MGDISNNILNVVNENSFKNDFKGTSVGLGYLCGILKWTGSIINGYNFEKKSEQSIPNLKRKCYGNDQIVVDIRLEILPTVYD